MGLPPILFIIIDALRARNLSCYGYKKPTSINLDRIARSGVIFKKCFSCTQTTDSSLTSIFSGKFPVSHGIINQGIRVTKQEIQNLFFTGTMLLPEILKKYDYTNMAIDWIDRWHKKGYDYYSGQNFTIYSRIIKTLDRARVRAARLPALRLFRRLAPQIKGKSARADIITSHAIKLIKKRKTDNFSLFIHYWDTHTPYTSYPSFEKKFVKYEDDDRDLFKLLNNIENPVWKNYLQKCMSGARTVGDVNARYDGAIAFTDREIGRILETLDDEGLSDKTFIIVTADHGESLTEHDIYYDHHGLYDVNVHVPLILKYPKILPKNKEINSLVQHTDLFPTILDLLGFEKIKSNLSLDGESLLPLINSERDKLHSAILLEEAYTQRKRAIRTKDYKFIYSMHGNKNGTRCRFCGWMHGDVEELYYLKKDREEQVNASEKNPYVKKILKGRLLKWISHLKKKKEREIIRRKLRIASI